MAAIVVAAAQFVASAFTVANIVAASIRILTYVAFSYASAALQGKPKGGGWRGDALQVSLDPNSPRTWLVGQTATAGSLVTFQTWGNKNEYIILIFAIADHPCQSLQGAWNNGARVTINGDGSVQDYYADGHHNCWVTFYSGDWNQAADSELISNSSGRWTTNDRGRGVCYIKVKARYNEKAFTSGLSTLFQFIWEVKGASVYDRRLDSTAGGSGAQRSNDASTWTYSTNAAVIVDHYLRGVSVEDTTASVATRARDRFMGLSLTNSDLPSAEQFAAANSCDDAITLKAGGTEPRYRVAGVIAATQDPATTLSDLLGAQAGKLTMAPGRWFQLPGVAQTSVRTFTDADFRVDAPITYTQDVPLDELANAVYGRFADPSNIYQAIELPPRLSPTDEAADGGRKPDTYDLSLVTSSTQGQRVQEIHRKRNRLQRRVQGTLGPENIDLEAGDWITYNSTRLGLSLTYEVVQDVIKLDDQDFFHVAVDLREINSTTYGWTPSTDELSSTVASTLPSASFTGSTATGVSVAASSVTSGSATVPALAVTLDAPIDPIAIGISIEYRVQGLPTGAAQTLTRRFDVNPALYVAGNTLTLTFADGVIGGYTYEARASIITRPARDPVWSSWTATSSLTVGSSSATVGGLTPAQINNALVPVGGNIVSKPTFEDGLAGQWTPTSPGTQSIVTVTGQTFTKAIQLTPASAAMASICNDPVATSFRGFSVLPGDVFFFDVMVDTSTVTAGQAALIGLDGGNDAGAYVNSAPQLGVSSGTGWTRYTYSGTIPAGVTKVRPYIYVTGGTGAARFANIYIGKAQPGATVGAKAGTNLVDSGGAVLGDSAIKNSAVTIGPNGALSGAGGGTVTIGGLGYVGDLNATYGAVWAGNVTGRPSNLSSLSGSEAINNALVPVGYNALVNSEFGSMTTAWSSTFPVGWANAWIGDSTNSPTPTDARITLADGTFAFQRTLSTGPNGTVFDVIDSFWVGAGYMLPCLPNDVIGASGLLAYHNCTGVDVAIIFFNAAGTEISEVHSSSTGTSNGTNVYTSLTRANLTPASIVATAPANTARAGFFVRAHITGSPSSPSAIIAAPMLAKLASGQTVVPPYSPGPPDLYATKGATAGSDLVDSGGAVLGDTAIKNNAISVDASGFIQGIGTGVGTAVKNSLISISTGGALSGAGGGAVTIGGLGYSGDLNATYGAAWGSNLSGVPTTLAAVTSSDPVKNSAISVDGSGLIQGIGTGAGTAVKNSLVSISSAGALSGAGGGTVTIGGLGYSGDLNATYGAQAGTSLKDSGGTVLGDAAVKNSAISVDASGLIQGIGTGVGTAVKNSLIAISGGALTGIGTGAGTVVANSAITVAAGVLTGIGTAGIAVDNTLVNPVTIGAVKTDASNAPGSILNSSINVDASGLIQGIGTGAGTAVKNTLISVSGGVIGGIGTGNGTAVANSAITIASGVLTGIGTSGVAVDNTLVNPVTIGAVSTSLSNAPASILNSNVTLGTLGAGTVATVTPPTYAGNAAALSALGAGFLFTDSTDSNKIKTTVAASVLPKVATGVGTGNITSGGNTSCVANFTGLVGNGIWSFTGSLVAQSSPTPYTGGTTANGTWQLVERKSGGTTKVLFSGTWSSGTYNSGAGGINFAPDTTFSNTLNMSGSSVSSANTGTVTVTLELYIGASSAASALAAQTNGITISVVWTPST